MAFYHKGFNRNPLDWGSDGNHLEIGKVLNVQVDCLSRPNITIISSAQTSATLIAIQTTLEEIVYFSVTKVMERCLTCGRCSRTELCVYFQGLVRSELVYIETQLK